MKKFLVANIKESEWDWLWWTWKVRWWIAAGFFALSLISIVFIIAFKANL